MENKTSTQWHILRRTALLLVLAALLAAACYQNQISHIDFETTKFRAIVLTNPIDVHSGLRPYQSLSEQTAVVMVYPNEQVINIPPQRIGYRADAAFINEECTIVRVLTGIPPRPADERQPPATTPVATATSEAPEIFYSSGYPAKYLAMTVAPLLSERSVQAGQKIKLTGPAASIACD